MNVSGSLTTLLKQKNCEIHCVNPEQTVYEAIQIMSEKNIGALPVLDAGRLVGMFSERDYTRKVALKGRSSRQTLVRDILSSTVITVSPSESIEECMRMMTEHRVRHLPVVENDQMIGIVSIGDLVNWTISAQSAALHQLQSYLTGQP